MSNVVNLDQYRELKRLLVEDEEFRAWAKAFIKELEDPEPIIDFSNIKSLSPYTITSVTIDGVDITPR